MDNISSASFTLICQYVRDRTYRINYPPEEFPAEIPMGHKVEGRVQACNYSHQTVYFKIRTWFINPQGQQVGLREWEGERAHSWCYSTNTVPNTLDQLGSWTLRAELYVDGVRTHNLQWNAINCIAEAPPPPVDVELDGYNLSHRVEGDWKLYPKEEWPVEIAEGEEINASVIAFNRGPETVSCQINVWLEDPTGATRAANTWSGNISSGWNRSLNCYPITLDRTGYWRIHGELYVDGKLEEKNSWLLLDCISYTPPPPEGTLVFSSVYNIDETKHYYDIPAILEVGMKVQGRTRRTNTNWVRQWMRTISWLRDPDGQIRGYNESNWVDTPPGGTTSSGTLSVILDKLGDWRLHAEVYAQVKVNGPSGAGTRVDSGSWHIIIAEEGEVTPPPPPPGEGSIHGIVIDADTGYPIQGATVQSGEHLGTTNEDGWYEIEGIPAGDYQFDYSAPGYHSTQRNVTIVAEGWTRLDVVLGDVSGPPPPLPDDREFPWLWVGLAGAVVAAIATHRKLKKNKAT